MDEKDSTTPVPREAWQRLLEDSTDGPPETTNARIRAAARRVAGPGGGSWWLPASLAASFVLAVLIAQSQLRPTQAPVVTESDGGPAGGVDAHRIDREQAEASRGPGPTAAAPARRTAPARAKTEPEEYGDPDSEFAADAAAAGPRVGGPERDLKAASEMAEEIPAAGPPAAVVGPEDPTAASTVTDSSRERAPARPGLQGVAPTAVAAKLPAPEAWYARIEELRKQGHVDEAKRELERLEQAYPGWLERHLQERAPR